MSVHRLSGPHSPSHRTHDGLGDALSPTTLRMAPAEAGRGGGSKSRVPLREADSASFLRFVRRGTSSSVQLAGH